MPTGRSNGREQEKNLSISFRDRRYEIYLAYQSNGQSQRATHRAIGVDPTTVIRWVREVEDEIARGAWTPPDGAIPDATPAPFVAVADRVSGDRQARQTAAQLQDLRDRYGHALEQIAELERQNEAMLSVRGPVAPIKINPSLSKEPKSEAVAIIQASDWHLEERVDPATVNWLNEYNPDIAEARAKRYFQNSLKLIRKERQDVHLKTLVWHLGGDLISNYLHAELEESNYLSPTEAIRFAKRIILGGLKMWKENADVDRIVVATSYGNHGRTTHKPRFSTGHKNNLEAMMYHDLAMFFEGDEVVEFQVADGYFNYLEIFDKTIRFSHGDAMKYGGGVGGLTIPVIKFIHRSNQQRKADADFFGHWHQLMPYSRVHGFAGNGSLIGLNAYALRIGASPEPPMQSFHLLDSRRGFTISAPIVVTE